MDGGSWSLGIVWWSSALDKGDVNTCSVRIIYTTIYWKERNLCWLEHSAKAISSNNNGISSRNKEFKGQHPLQQLPREHYIGSKKSRSNNMNPIRKHSTISLPDLQCQAERFKNHLVHIVSGQFSGVARLFDNISSESSPQQKTPWTRIACPPSHTVVIKYAKAKHAAYKKK